MSDPAARSPGGARRSDVYVDIALVSFAALVYWETTRFPEVPAILSQNVPPTFFPRLVLTAIVLLSTLLYFRGRMAPVEPREAVPKGVYLTAAAMTAAVWLIPRLGTFTTIALVAIGLPLLWGERRPLRIGLLALALPLGVFLVFALALDMRFPVGVLP